MPEYILYQSIGTRERMEDNAWTDGASRLVVCDGMGGELHGDIASRAACELAQRATPGEIRRDVLEAVSSTAGHGAGTTLSVAWLDGDTLRWLHAGDSALWLVVRSCGSTTIRRLTADQSMWGAMVASGSEPASVSKRRKGILVSYIMAGEHVTWDEGQVSIDPEAKTWVFGTTDGFHEAFEDQSGSVDHDRLLDGLRDIVRSGPEDAQTWMDGCGKQTHDNATLVGWRVR